MTVLRVSAAVREAMGPANADALAAGVGLPAQVQCCDCGEMADTASAAPLSLCLSTVVIGVGRGAVTISVFSHESCGPSRVFTAEEFEAIAERLQAVTSRPVRDLRMQDGEQVADETGLIVGGERVL
jgi:hypothetical protein